jgi:uncharacterized coiled-coil DUF342 family protein
MSIQQMLADMTPEAMRKKFHALGREADKKNAQIAPTREAFEAGRAEIDDIRKRIQPLRLKIQKHNEAMGPIMKARSMLSRALKGKTGSAG